MKRVRKIAGIRAGMLATVSVLALLLVGGIEAWHGYAAERNEQKLTETIDQQLGITVEPLGGRLLPELAGVEDLRGLVVTSVAQGGPARSAGLQAGDVIEQLDGFAITDPSSLSVALNRDRQPVVTLFVERGHDDLRISIKRQSALRSVDASVI